MPRKTTQPTGPQAIVKPVRHHTGPVTTANIAGYECWTVPTNTDQDSNDTPHKIIGPRLDATRPGALYGTFTDAMADMRDLGYTPIVTFKNTRALVQF